ncbi:putative disease resistance protein RDL6 [Glycine max]|nr:putative disease resistance protein RDL6 [Glycine max]
MRIDLQFDVCAPVLQKVRIVGGLKEFPNWVAKLQNLVTLSLRRTYLTVDPLPLLKELPYLSSLFINRSAYEGKVLQFPNRGFQNLKQILLGSLFILKSIVIEDGALPSLEKFKLVGIPELKEVPSGLYKLPKLEFPNRGFQNLNQILLNRLIGLKSIVIEDGALPSLEKLKLVDIPRLKKVPSGLSKLPKLEAMGFKCHGLLILHVDFHNNGTESS